MSGHKLNTGKKNFMYGKHHTEEAKRKIGAKHKGKVLSAETKEKISKGMTGKRRLPFSKEWRDKMSKSKMGSLNHRWRNGITCAITKRVSTRLWRILATKIRKRDNHWCLYCRDARGISVHHMLPTRLGGTDDEENLVTLCRSCHCFIESKIIS